MKINRALWLMILVATAAGAWFSGERILYVASVVLFVLPVFSYILTFFMLKKLRVFQGVPKNVLKNDTSNLIVRLHNVWFLPFGGIEILIHADENAFIVPQSQFVPLNPFEKKELEIPFVISYRGHFELGIKSVLAIDITGLFKLNRKFDVQKPITSLPLVVDMADFPLAMNLMTQAHSRFDIRDEDYATISDIRAYQPTDSIKRVHWKLTAKRNEWLVKMFQSNALNSVTILLDSQRPALPPKEALALEDIIIETALGLAKFCLKKNMPVDMLTTEGHKACTRTAAEFDVIYQTAAELRFAPETAMSCPSILNSALIDASGYINAVIFTANLTAGLYERIINGANNGHYIAVLYFCPPTTPPDEDSEEIFRSLTEGGMPCFRLVPPSGS
ncbi:MAG: DUF58 domain-containing protein [Defluviitaleaceae bacterium]|nr:DUF58 domain-containing protein [Defluviitaleaceae bacterium]